MSATPEDVGQEPKKSEEQGTTPTPEAPEPKAPEGQDDELRRLKEENKQLRASRREETAKRLTKEHSLPDAVAELLKTIPENEMEERAKAIAEQMPKVEGSETPSESKEPEAKEKLEKVATAGDQGAQAPEVPDRGESDLLKKVKGAGSLAEVEKIQEELRQQARQAQ